MSRVIAQIESPATGRALFRCENVVDTVDGADIEGERDPAGAMLALERSLVDALARGDS